MLELFQVLDEAGREVGPVPEGLADEQLIGMLRQMLLGRHLDAKAISLQRRGKLGTFAPMSGQEAISVGSVARPRSRGRLARAAVPGAAGDAPLRSRRCRRTSSSAKAIPAGAALPAGHPAVPAAGLAGRAPAPCRRGGLGHAAPRGGIGGHRLLRRRRQLRGRLPRGVQPGRGASGAGDLHVLQQPVRHLDARLAPDRGGVDRRPRPGLRHRRRAGRRQRRARRVRGHPSGQGSGSGRRGADADRGDHLPPRRAHDGGRPEPLRGRRRRTRAWKARDPIMRMRTWLQGPGPVGRRGGRAGREVVRGRDRARRRGSGGGRPGRSARPLRGTSSRRSRCRCNGNERPFERALREGTA